VKIVIYGLAKSGTSALFYKIRNSLPPGTIELFEPSSFGPLDRVRARLRALRRGHVRPDVVAKLLPWDRRPVRIGDFDGFDRRILLVRDPRDRLVSDLLYRSYNAAFAADGPRALEFLRLLRAKEAEPGEVPILRLVEAFDRLERAAGSRADWIERYQRRGLLQPMQFHVERPRLAVFRYEQLVDCQFASLEAALGMSLGGPAEVPPALNRVVRTKRYGAWRDWFTPEDVDSLRPMLTPYLDLYYPSADWDLNPSPSLDPEEGSLYVERIISERRDLLGLPRLADRT
jgi:hypothetical protein